MRIEDKYADTSVELARRIFEDFGVDFDEMRFREEMKKSMEESFSSKKCWTVEQAIRFKFPHIRNLDVSMNDEGLISIIFDQTDDSPSQQEVTEFLAELKKGGTNIAPSNQPQ